MTDTVSFYLSKIFWVLLAPSHLLVLLLLLSFIIAMPQMVRYGLQGVVMLCLLAALIFPVGEWMALPLEQCYIKTQPPMQRIDGIVVLGGALDPRISDVRRAPSFNAAADRIMGLLKLMREYPQAAIIYSGGSGSTRFPDFDEASVVKNYLRDIGFPVDRLTVENQSHNTYENAVFTTALIRQMARDSTRRNWLLVTSAAHLPRAMALFESAGAAKQVFYYPYAVDFKTIGWFDFEATFDLPGSLERIDNTVKEYLGLVLNKMLGKSDTLWPCAA